MIKEEPMYVCFQHFTRYKLIYLGSLIQLLYFFSAFHTGWFSSLFTGDSLHHCCRGMDFYQIPNGAYAYWHGGSLEGTPLLNGAVYAEGHVVNYNVYHPLFTLILGTPLLLLPPTQAFYAWMIIKLLLTLAVTAYFFWSFRKEKYIGLAVFVLLANASEYLEMAISQFQSVLNVLLLLLLIALVKNQSEHRGGVLYCLTLLVKPIGLLWLGVLLCKRRFKAALTGIFLFVALTVVPFLVDGSGSYYLSNLSKHLLSTGTDGPVQIITLRALLLYSTPLPGIVITAIGDAALVLVLFFGSLKRIHIAKGMFLAVVYYLCFYDLVYEYQWTSLAPVIAVCLICCPEFQTRLSRCFVLLTCLPSAFVLLTFWHIDVTTDSFFSSNPGTLGWQWMVVSKVGPVLLLTISVLIRDIGPIYKQTKSFWKALREVNGEMKVFG